MAGTWTFAQFTSFLKFMMGNRTDLESPTDYYDIWVNDAYIQLTTQDKFWGINRSFRFPQLETSKTYSTADGTAYIAVPDNALIIREVYDTTNNKRLTWIPWQEYIKKTDRTDTSAEANPTKWTRYENSVYLYPTPGSVNVMTEYYRKIPAVLSGSGTSELDTAWDNPILLLAAYKGFLWMGEYDKAKTMRQEFVDTIGSLMTIYGQEEKARVESWRPDEAYMQFTYDR